MFEKYVVFESFQFISQYTPTLSSAEQELWVYREKRTLYFSPHFYIKNVVLMLEMLL